MKIEMNKKYKTTAVPAELSVLWTPLSTELGLLHCFVSETAVSPLVAPGRVGLVRSVCAKSDGHALGHCGRNGEPMLPEREHLLTKSWFFSLKT